MQEKANFHVCVIFLEIIDKIFLCHKSQLYILQGNIDGNVRKQQLQLIVKSSIITSPIIPKDSYPPITVSFEGI